MTQMGLEYQKHLENKRHNLATEGVQRGTLQESIRHNLVGESIDSRDVAQKEYVASFKPREVVAAEQQAAARVTSAQAAQSQAKTAAGRLQLDERYRERETRADELRASASDRQASASVKQADVAQQKQSFTEWKTALDAMPEMMQQTEYLKTLAKDNPLVLAEYGLGKLYTELDEISNVLGQVAGMLVKKG